MRGKLRAFLDFCWTVLIVTLLLWTCCEAAPPARSKHSPTGVRLVINKITPGQSVTDHDWGLVRLEVGVETRRLPALRKQSKMRRSVLRVKVDDKEVPYQLLDSNRL